MCVWVCVYTCIKSYQSGCSETEQSGCIATQPPHPFWPLFPFLFLLLCVWGFQLQRNLKTSIKLSFAHLWACHLAKIFFLNQHSACVHLCPVGLVCRSHKAEHMKEERDSLELSRVRLSFILCLNIDVFTLHIREAFKDSEAMGRFSSLSFFPLFIHIHTAKMRILHVLTITLPPFRNAMLPLSSPVA